MKIELAHSCCPRKVDINAPAFHKQDALALSNGKIMEQWECELCRTVVLVLISPEAAG